MFRIERNFYLSRKTSYKIGGAAEYYAEPFNPDEFANVIEFVAKNELDVKILGRGSNLLVSDDGVEGMVINMQNLNKIKITSNETILAFSGIILNNFVRYAIEHSFSGVEELIGIPGTLGGAIIMNAGAFNQNISTYLKSVKIFNPKLSKIKKIDASGIEFRYRGSSLKDLGLIVLSAEFEFPKREKSELRSISADIIAKRNLKQPLNYPSCGSVFKRPDGNYAGALIEKCGLKGFTIGGAQISEKHANFIVNLGNATAEDVRAVIAHVQKCVYESDKILLEPEVIFWGNFKTKLFKP